MNDKSPTPEKRKLRKKLLPNMHLYEAPKEAVNDFMIELHYQYHLWYDREAKKTRFLWNVNNFLLIATSILTTALAAIQTSSLSFVKDNIEIFQTCLVLTPIAGTSLSALLVQTKSLNLYNLREQGRLDFQNLLNEGKRRYSIASSDTDYADIHKLLVEETNRIEKQQAHDFFNTVGESNSKDKNPKDDNNNPNQ